MGRGPSGPGPDPSAALTFHADPRLQAAVAAQMERRPVLARRLVNSVRSACRKIPSFEAFLAMDADAFERLFTARDGRATASRPARGVLRDAFLECGGPPETIEGGAGARAAAAAAVLAAHPGLRDWPPHLAAWLGQRLSDPADRAHCLALLEPVDERLRQQYPARDPLRSRRALAEMCKCFFAVLLRMRGADDEPLSRTLPLDLDNAGLRLFLARMLLTWLAMPGRNARRTQRVCESPMARGLVNVVKRAAKCGVFPRLVLRPLTFALRDLHDAMRELVGAEALAALEAPGVTAERAPRNPSSGAPAGWAPSDEAVERLRRVAERDPRDRLLVALLGTTGLRLGAVRSLTVHHLWDGRRSRPTPRFTVMEKNSQPRTVVPCRELRDAVTAYMAQPRARRWVYVFAAPHRSLHRPARHIVADRLRRLCRAAAVPEVRPHAFRAYLVTVLRERGLPVDLACRFVGHQTREVQDRHYWREDAERVGSAALAQSDEHTFRGLRRRIEAARTELRALQDRAERRERLDQAPPPSLVAGPPGSPQSSLDAYMRGLATA